jgi:hypothetical protein
MNETTAITRRPVVDQIFGDNKAPIEVVLDADFTAMADEIARFEASAAEAPKKVSSDEDLTAIGALIKRSLALSGRVEDIRTTEGRPILDAQRGINSFFNGRKDRIAKAVAPLQKAADAYAVQKAAEAKAKLVREAQEAREKAEAERKKADEAKTAQTAAKAEGRAEALDAKADDLSAAAMGSQADMVRTKGDGVTASARASWTFRVDDYSALQATLGPLGPFLAQADVEKAIRSYVRIQKGNTKLAGVAVYEDVKAAFR